MLRNLAVRVVLCVKLTCLHNVSRRDVFRAELALSCVYSAAKDRKKKKKREENPATCVDERSHSPPSVFQRAARGVVHPSTVAEKKKKNTHTHTHKKNQPRMINNLISPLIMLVHSGKVSHIKEMPRYSARLNARRCCLVTPTSVWITTGRIFTPPE